MPASASKGSLPRGVAPGDEKTAADQIRAMFGRVAPRYDLLNRLLSGRIDTLWRRRLTAAVRPALADPKARVLDLCCGTGDVALGLARERERLAGSEARPVIAGDFSRPMLDLARRKLGAPLVELDALRCPLPDGSIDLITMAFGFRNLTNYDTGLQELTRLLAPGGRLAILEFSQPELPLLAQAYGLYFEQILPRIGNALSGAGNAYSYLQSSVERFLSPVELAVEMQRAGLRDVGYESLTGGIACLHLGRRA